MTSTSQQTSWRIGEVIEATSTSFVAQCYELYGAPALGSFVRVGDPEVFGIVRGVATQPLDPSRPILARGEGLATEEELHRDNPQLQRLLTTRFETLIVGDRRDGLVRAGLPPYPPRVHSFVHSCDPAEMARLTLDPGFIHLLFSAVPPLPDEVVRTVLQLASEAHVDRGRFLAEAGRAVATELSGDLPRLNAVIRRLQQ
jgi:hypothetical protein